MHMREARFRAVIPSRRICSSGSSDCVSEQQKSSPPKQPPWPVPPPPPSHGLTQSPQQNGPCLCLPLWGPLERIEVQSPGHERHLFKHRSGVPAHPWGCRTITPLRFQNILITPRCSLPLLPAPNNLDSVFCLHGFAGPGLAICMWLNDTLPRGQAERVCLLGPGQTRGLSLVQATLPQAARITVRPQGLTCVGT